MRRDGSGRKRNGRSFRHGPGRAVAHRRVPVVQSIQPTPSSVVEPGDPVPALAGRAVEAIGKSGVDVVLRIGAEGFRLPDGERLYDVHGDRVLAARSGDEGATATLVVRDLEGELVREINAGMQVPQTGIVRGEDVYFGGIDLGEGGNLDEAADRGVWVAHGDAAPEPVLPAEPGVAIYTAIERSPDGRTLVSGGAGRSARRSSSAPRAVSSRYPGRG